MDPALPTLLAARARRSGLQAEDRAYWIARRAEVFLLNRESAAGIVFHIRMVTAKPVITDSVGAGMEV